MAGLLDNPLKLRILLLVFDDLPALPPPQNRSSLPVSHRLQVQHPRQGVRHHSTGVEQVALQNAASIAGQLLTTDAAVVELKKKKKKKKKAVSEGGGMDDMVH